MSESNLIEALEATLDPVRTTVSSRVEQTSLRAVAREIGLSPAGLKAFLAGTTPYSPTLRRLRLWYVRYGTRTPGLSVLDARAALDVLLRDLLPEARRGAALSLIESLGRDFDESGQPRPAWLRDLHAGYAASPHRDDRRSVLGKYRDLGPASEEFARAKQAEIDREDRSAA